MTTYREFCGMLYAVGELSEIVAAIQQEANEINDRGDSVAAIAKLNQAEELSVRMRRIQLDLIQEPSYDRFRTILLAEGSDVTIIAVDRLAAVAGVKRGLTLRELSDRPADSVAEMAAVDARAAKPVSAAAKADTKRTSAPIRQRKSKISDRLKFTRMNFAKGLTYPQIAVLWQERSGEDISPDALRKSLERAGKPDK